MAGMFSQVLQQAAQRRAQLAGGGGGVATQRGPGIQAGAPPMPAMFGRQARPTGDRASPLMLAAMRRMMAGGRLR